MSRYSYRIEGQYDGEWITILKDCGMQFGTGYMYACVDCRQGPSPAMRLIRSDGKILDELKKKTEVSLGMIAGFPTADQYLAAADRAIAIAKKIQDHS